MVTKSCVGCVTVFKLAQADGTACDTVGAVVRDALGNLAGAGSTGGVWCALQGRVGDTPIPGAGIDVDAQAAVCATGVGETIWQLRLAQRAHQALTTTTAATTSRVLEDLLQNLPNVSASVDLGLIAIGPHGVGAACTRRMPWAYWEGDKGARARDKASKGKDR